VALSKPDAGALTVLSGAACLVFGTFGFVVAVPWVTAVMPVSEAMERCPGAIDPALAWLQLIVGWGAFFALGARLKRYR
jgi:hypothetical protein